MSDDELMERLWREKQQDEEYVRKFLLFWVIMPPALGTIIGVAIGAVGGAVMTIPAFPRPLSAWESSKGDEIVHEQDGMGLDDYFAGQAITAVMHELRASIEYTTASEEVAKEILGRACYFVADALMAEHRRRNRDGS